MSKPFHAMAFHTDKIACRLLTEKDVVEYCDLYTNKKVMRNIAEPLSQSQAEAQLTRAIRFNQSYLNGNAPRCLTYTIFDNDNKFIGTQGLVWSTSEEKQAEIGIMLTQKASGKGYPVEAMGALTDFGLCQLELASIYAHFQPKNIVVERFVRKLGYAVDETLVMQDKTPMKYCHIDLTRWQRSTQRVNALLSDETQNINQQEVINGN